MDIGDKIYGTIYDKVLLILKGMTNSGKQSCYNFCKENKTKLLNAALNIIDYIQKISPATPEFSKIIAFLPLDLIANPIFFGDCQIEDLYALFRKFSNDDDRVG